MYPGVDQQNRGHLCLCLGSNSTAASIRTLRFERCGGADGLLVTEISMGQRRKTTSGFWTSALGNPEEVPK